ncbi:hypothetical protein [Sphingobium sp. B11D3A]|uniref:DUF7931 domain-containing protein n=1 Tax=Sphingobium sp. B11D3A TaxID=2940574 RepID=UPI002225439C|nr:hypothetical protein [Sphingobium sp. B11D3A]MCW2390953.1 hypothetical protein [Sphingobium sp. B11D3A]
MNLEDYRSHIDRLIREQTGQPVLNGSHGHASILIERMFANASSSVRILTRRFDPRIYGTSETVEQAELFLGQRDRKAYILVEEYEESEFTSHPFFERLSKHVGLGNLEVRQVNPELTDKIAINFAVMDDTGWRIEKDKTKAVAVAAFGSREMAKRCVNLFETVWDVSSNFSIDVRVNA